VAITGLRSEGSKFNAVATAAKQGQVASLTEAIPLAGA